MDTSFHLRYLSLDSSKAFLGRWDQLARDARAEEAGSWVGLLAPSAVMSDSPRCLHTPVS